MQVGGHLAQFGPPDEILASPASEFVARFVGADRGLKRLSLSRVGDIPPQPAVMARVGDDASAARKRMQADPFAYLLLVDSNRRPIGWVHQDRIPKNGRLDASNAVAMSPLLNRRTTLKDALSMLLDADVQAGIVVDRHGAVMGLLTVDMIADRMRQTAGDGRYAAVAAEVGAGQEPAVPTPA
jgi:osmoprotectant transport system ATP-binding protein